MRFDRVVVVVVMVLMAMGAGCEIAAPFAGPGWSDEGPTIGEGPYFVAATHLVLPEDDAETQEVFSEAMGNITDVLDAQPGLVGYSLRQKLFGRDNWTVTVCASEADAVAWVSSDVHVDAMVAMADRAEAGETTHWEAEASELPPTWDDVMERLGTSGRSAY